MNYRTVALNDGRTVAPTSRDDVNGLAVLMALGGWSWAQEQERKYRVRDIPQYRERATAICKHADRVLPTPIEDQPFGGLDVRGAAFCLGYALGRALLCRRAELYVARLSVRHLCDLIVEIARDVLPMPDSHYVTSVVEHLNAMQLVEERRARDGQRVLRRFGGTDARHCHTVVLDYC